MDGAPRQTGPGEGWLVIVTPSTSDRAERIRVSVDRVSALDVELSQGCVDSQRPVPIYSYAVSLPLGEPTVDVRVGDERRTVRASIRKDRPQWVVVSSYGGEPPLSVEVWNEQPGWG